MNADKPVVTKEELEKLVETSPIKKGFRTRAEIRAARWNHNMKFGNKPNRVAQKKAKRLADANRKRQRGCKRHRTGVKPKRS